MENKKFKSLSEYNLDFISDSTLDANDQIKIILLTSFVKKICKVKDGKYYFTKDDETVENHKLFEHWMDVILRNAPCANKAQIRGSIKKVYIILKHLVKHLDAYGIKIENGSIDIKEKNDEIITKQVYFITGL